MLRDVVKVLKLYKRTQVTLGMAEHCLPLFAPNKSCWEQGGDTKYPQVAPCRMDVVVNKKTLKLIITMMVSESTTHMHILPT
jgi:hypothetical protein